MLKIGITGNIGSGKTTVSKLFELLGIPVFYADDVAKNIMVTDELLATAIRSIFGHKAYLSNGNLNRKHIAAIVFNDKAQLVKLNELVHPAVFRAFDNWVQQIEDAPYVIKEAALLFESASYKTCNKSILVTAPLETRIKRVMQRDGITSAEVERRNMHQFTEAKKIQMADYVIKNNDKELIIPQVLALHQGFLSLAK